MRKKLTTENCVKLLCIWWVAKGDAEDKCDILILRSLNIYRTFQKKNYWCSVFFCWIYSYSTGLNPGLTHWNYIKSLGSWLRAVSYFPSLFTIKFTLINYSLVACGSEERDNCSWPKFKVGHQYDSSLWTEIICHAKRKNNQSIPLSINQSTNQSKKKSNNVRRLWPARWLCH